MIVLETERLLLQRFTLRDAAFVLRLLNEPAFLQHIGDKGVRTLEQARSYLRLGPLASYRQHGHGLYRVSLKDGTPIGMCGLLKRDQLPHRDLGYAFLAEHWSKGYAFEAASATLEHGRGTLALDVVLALISPGNASSVRLAEKLGFRSKERRKMPSGSDEVLVFERCF